MHKQLHNHTVHTVQEPLTQESKSLFYETEYDSLNSKSCTRLAQKTYCTMYINETV